jgi:hypothetical protein
MPIVPEETTATQSTTDFYSLLERAGFEIRGRRANCPHSHCDGHARLTVALGPGDVYHCHRCKCSGNARTLARQLRIAMRPESREALERRALEERFENWRSKRQKFLAKKFHTLYRRAEWARVALSWYPSWELAWAILAEFYSREAELSVALDGLSCEKAGIWLDEPTTRAELFAAFQEACRAPS